MGTAALVLAFRSDREKAKRWIDGAPVNSRITFKGPQRTTPQNERMWVLLTIISTSLEWDGRYHNPDKWKDYFMGVLNREETMSAEDGGPPIAVGRSTSNLDKDQHGDLTMLMEAFCARQGVVIPEPAKKEGAA